jgi:glycosyltransferase involved in cell wall biosynthesis
MEKVSIVMPVYNGAKYIKESIKSILLQTYENFEFIIVNEFGSNDGSKEIIEEFAAKDSRIILIQNKKKEGISESLNIALRAATGEYIARMDSDDIAGKDRLKAQVDFLDKNPNIGLCGIQPEFFGEEKIFWEL